MLDDYPMKQLLGNERQVAYSKMADELRAFQGRVTRKTALEIIHQIAQEDTDWK